MPAANRVRATRLAACASALLCIAAQAQANVYKCPDDKGKIVIQQLPCTGGTVLDVRPSTGNDASANARNAERGSESGNNQEILTSIGQRRPAVGMSESTLKMAMGVPTRINRGNYNGRQSDQVIYERSDGTWYVYVRDGVVSSTQFQDYPNRSSSRAACPSSLAIRNMETSANSVTISRERKRELQRQVAEAKACS